MDILRKLTDICAQSKRKLSPIEYWKTRVEQYGERSVLNITHTQEEISEVTKKQKDEIFPYFINALKGDEKLLLDFGCGYGRFTSDLARLINGKAIGLDIIPELIAMAPQHDNVDYEVMREGVIQLPDEHVGVVWGCLVLGGIKGNVLTDSINEINRVLKTSGLLFLIENTSEISDCEYWTYRSIKQYQKICSFVELTHLHDYHDCGQRISIMAGRKS
jgi:SAM-dependent methyltransferase